jgi:hypothetical protein
VPADIDRSVRFQQILAHQGEERLGHLVLRCFFQWNPFSGQCQRPHVGGGIMLERCHSIGEWIYTSNAGSSTISWFTIAAGGRLTALPGTIAGTNPAGATNLDMAITSDGQFLYTLDAKIGEISIFGIQSDGTLTNLGTVDELPQDVGFNGIAAIQLSASCGDQRRSSFFPKLSDLLGLFVVPHTLCSVLACSQRDVEVFHRIFLPKRQNRFLARIAQGPVSISHTWYRNREPTATLTQKLGFHAAGYQGKRVRTIFLNSDIDFRHFYLEDSLKRNQTSGQPNRRYLAGAMKTG